MRTPPKKLAIYQTKDGAIAFRGDFEHETIWGTQKQIAELFEVNVRTVNEHLKNIYKDGELKEKATIRNFRIVQREGKRMVEREINFYNLDAIISVGYRINSKKATRFRIWATKTLKQHLTKGYTINKKALKRNHQEFLQAVEDIKLLAKDNRKVGADDVLELIKAFSATWFNLESYDKQAFPKSGKKRLAKRYEAEKMAENLQVQVQLLKQDLVKKGEATELFAQEKKPGALAGIVGNVLQSVFGKDAYPTVEEKAAHLLYFIIKNHPFTDGNKRTGAFSFLWFLRNVKFPFEQSITPEALTALTLLVAESDPKDKERMIGLILLLLQANNKK